jgi:hypothetical protein
VRALDLPPGEALLDEEKEADKREGDVDRLGVGRGVLRRIGVHQQLVVEEGVPKGERVAGHIALQREAFGGRARLGRSSALAPKQAQATSRTERDRSVSHRRPVPAQKPAWPPKGVYLAPRRRQLSSSHDHIVSHDLRLQASTRLTSSLFMRTRRAAAPLRASSRYARR